MGTAESRKAPASGGSLAYVAAALNPAEGGRKARLSEAFRASESLWFAGRVARLTSQNSTDALIFAKRGVTTDYRGTRLRFGFGIYHDRGDVDRLIAVLDF